MSRFSLLFDESYSTAYYPLRYMNLHIMIFFFSNSFDLIRFVAKWKWSIQIIFIATNGYCNLCNLFIYSILNISEYAFLNIDLYTIDFVALIHDILSMIS